MKKFLFLLVRLFLFLIPKPAFAATTYDMADSSKWNIRIDGAALMTSVHGLMLEQFILFMMTFLNSEPVRETLLIFQVLQTIALLLVVLQVTFLALMHLVGI